MKQQLTKEQMKDRLYAAEVAGNLNRNGRDDTIYDLQLAIKSGTVKEIRIALDRLCENFREVVDETQSLIDTESQQQKIPA